jgi:hypothetical protein
MLNLRPSKDSFNVKPLKNDNVINIKGLRKQNLPYIFIWVVYYAWVIAFATWWTASPLTDSVFGMNIRSLLHSVNLLSSALFIFIIKKEQFVKTAKIGAVLIVLGMSIFLTFHDAYLQLTAAIIIGLSLGLVNTSILMPFVFALNNTEKLYAVVGSNVLINIISYVQEKYSINGFYNINGMLMSFFILILALSTILFF